MISNPPEDWLTKATEAGKAELKGKPKTAPAPIMPIATRQQIKGVWKQYPTLATVFGVIMRRWRTSTATRPGASGYWAAYTQPDWATLAGVSVSTWKRTVDLLVAHGLVERDAGRYGGIRVLTFLRPTLLALTLSDAKAWDLLHLDASPEPAQSIAQPQYAPKKPVLPPKPIPPPEPKATLEDILAPIEEDAEDGPE